MVSIALRVAGETVIVLVVLGVAEAVPPATSEVSASGRMASVRNERRNMGISMRGWAARRSRRP
jgi:hypothetical protein